MWTLFRKIFVTFWLALILAGVVAFLMADRSHRAGSQHGMATAFHDNLLGRHAQAVTDAFAKDGKDGVDAYMRRIEAETSVRLFLIPARPDLTSRQPPRDAVQFAEEFSRQTEGPRKASRWPSHVAKHLPLGEGEPVVLVAELRPHLGRPPVMFLALLVTSGTLCFLVARSLTRPIRVLQNATRELAAGNLSVRVGPAVTGRRDELAALARDFDEMAARIETVRTAEQRLLRDVSHELRSPLARLHVALGLARNAANDATAPSLDRIEREGNRLNAIIGQLLAITRSENPDAAPATEPVRLDELLREVVADAAYEAKPRDVGVTFTADAGCLVKGDASLLRSAAENIIRNALFYTAAGTSVEVALSRNGSDAVLTVRDRGPGVPEDALAKLFRPFFRVEEARERDSGGTGLGLAIAERAVRVHAGTIRAENMSDGGLRIEVRLPCAPSPTD